MSQDDNQTLIEGADAALPEYDPGATRVEGNTPPPSSDGTTVEAPVQPSGYQELLERLVVSQSEALQEAAKEIQETYLNAHSPVLAEALQKTVLTDVDAVLLLACDRQLLWSKKQQWLHDSEAFSHALDAVRIESQRHPINRALLEELLQQLSAIEEKIRRRLEELSHPRPLEEGLDAQIRDHLQRCREAINDLIAKNDQQQRAQELATAGQVKTARKLVGGPDRIFNDVDYSAIDQALHQWTNFYIPFQTEAWTLEKEMQAETPSWFAPVALFKRVLANRPLQQRIEAIFCQLPARRNGRGHLERHPARKRRNPFPFLDAVTHRPAICHSNQRQTDLRPS